MDPEEKRIEGCCSTNNGQCVYEAHSMLNVAERTLYLLLNLCSYVELCNIAVEDRGLGNWTTFSWIIVF